MKITIMTLYRGRSCETYVAAVEGAVTKEREAELAGQLNLATEDGEALDTLGFQEVELHDGTLMNAFPEDRTHEGECDEDDD